ncbi:MAG: arginine N-succinyltransferase [Bdellovibrionales bacterium CG10_big_fil_rev_8_21_14_0_10_45_34]|nr:MAG: arginine N-succinyltransferase [Bdellovibrionales bacterium CG10_big_fil_rev_8_21_14_0_10_45_34]
MSFRIRSARESDLRDIQSLAAQFSLLNLPDDEEVLEKKLARSVLAFSDECPIDKSECEYVFVIEDSEVKRVVGCSVAMAKHGTEEVPHISFQVNREQRFSRDLGIGFIHQVLRLKLDHDGPTEVGGLLVDRSFRSRPEKLGRQISLIRFVYMGLEPTRFEERLLCEFAPPLTREGRSEFWEALGRRFTGLPYQEADVISHRHKEFIQSLFPTGDIYLTLLDTRARQVLGQVGGQTKPAQHLLEAQGFKYLNEVDPFDGGPHFGCLRKEVKIISQGKKLKLKEGVNEFPNMGLIGLVREGEFFGCQSAYSTEASYVNVPSVTRKLLSLSDGEELFVSPS